MYNTKNKTQKVYAKNKPVLNLIPKNCVCVFPIEIVGGKTQVSNQGIMPNRKFYDKGSFLYWQEVFDGRSALKIQWEDSITLEKPENSNYYLAKPSVGKYYYGKPISNGTEQLEISEDASFEDFMSMKASQSVTLRFEYDPTNRTASWYELQEKFRFTLVDNDIYNLYLIPELCEEKILYISEYQEYYDDLTGESKGCEITFSSLGDKIQKSGKAIEQYCSWNAPGEFSVRPMVIDYYDETEEEWSKQVIYNPIKYYYPTPVKYLQVEQQGPALTSCIYALGRTQEWVTVTDPETGEEKGYWKIGPTKFLLPYRFITTQANPLNRTATPSKNFFCLPNEQVTMVTTADLMKFWEEGSSQPLEQIKNAGMITIGENWNDLTAPTDNKSNPVSGGIRKDYFDDTWYPLGYTGAYLTAHDTSGCIYSADTIAHTATDTMIDIMNKNVFIYNSQPIIPLSFYSTRPYYLRDIPLIGNIANFFKLGDIKLNNNTTSRKATSLCLFGDADILTMCANLNGKMGTVTGLTGALFPINFFGTNESMYQKLGVNSVNTTFCFELTDRIKLDNVPWNTLYLGQSTYEDGTYLFPSTHQSLLVNSTLKALKADNPSFIIDAIVVQSIFDGKIKLSCFSEEEQNFIYPEWTATILSNANWEGGHMRDWTNVFLLSNWEERFCKQEDEFYWPLSPHKKEITEDYIWDINVEENFEYTWNGDKTEAGTNSWQKPTSTTTTTWSNVKEIGGGISGYKVDKEVTLFEQTKAYSDLGVASVTDRDTFIQHYKAFDFNFNGSQLMIAQIADQIKNRITGQTFETGTYLYTQELDLCSAFYNKGIVKINPPFYDFQSSGVPYTYDLGPHTGSQFDQHIEIRLELGTSAITYKIVDKSFLQNVNTIARKWTVGKGCMTYSQPPGRPQGEPAGFRSLIKSNDIRFIKR